jgi:hypothetical protein
VAALFPAIGGRADDPVYAAPEFSAPQTERIMPPSIRIMLPVT